MNYFSPLRDIALLYQISSNNLKKEYSTEIESPIKPNLLARDMKLGNTTSLPVVTCETSL